MADSSTTQAPPQAVQAAAEILARHPAVLESSVDLTGADPRWVLAFEVHVEMPRDAIDAGVTSTGVQAREPVRLTFDDAFPFRAPRIELRQDFNRGHPHINPTPPEDLVNPCVSELPLHELIQGPGWIDELVNQLTQWLNDAASGDLMDCRGQGWEPIRRDEIEGNIVFDPAPIREHAARMGGPGCHYFGYAYMPETPWGYTSKLTHLDAPANQYSDTSRFKPFHRTKNISITTKMGLGLVLWAGRKHQVDKYLPDDICNLDGLLRRAKVYGCHTALEARIKELQKNVTGLGLASVDFAVVFVVQRPCNVIGQDSAFEMIPYVLTVDVNARKSLEFSRTRVRALGHVGALTTHLLARLSGREPVQNVQGPIMMVGCGSLGSKIALHLARSGLGPFRLIDKDTFMPHNNARHGNIWGNGLTVPKTELLAHALKDIDAEVTPLTTDIVRELARCPQRAFQSASIIIDTTASNSVREAFSGVPEGVVKSPVVRGELYAQGRLAVLGIEGEERNPRIDDMTAQLYQLGLDNEAVGDCLYQRFDHARVLIGHSCGSYTMAMSDAYISLHAAGMAQRIQQVLDGGFPPSGEMLVGSADENDLGIYWQSIVPWRMSVYKASTGVYCWEVRLPDHLVQRMTESLTAARPNETGGILIGHISWGRRVITVTDLLDPPPDSVMTPCRFVLGTEGLREKLRRLEARTGGVVTYLGTWHSHPNGGGASQLDEETLARLVAMRELVPTACLIIGPDGVHAVPGQATIIG